MLHTGPVQIMLPLHLPEHHKPVAKVAETEKAAKSDNDQMRDGQAGTHAGGSQQTASLFAARLSMSDDLDFPPLDTRVAGDMDKIDPNRPTARVPDPLLSLEEAQAGMEAPNPAPEPLISLDEARAEPVAPMPKPVELAAAADAQAEAAETAATKVAEAEGPLSGAEAPEPQQNQAPAPEPAPRPEPAPPPQQAQEPAAEPKEQPSQ